ncbi:MAG TPA: glycoside hydrolase family 2 TIM barrel-domain containing protein, partial [Bryobacteraceae bacterium]|nr:glycoside hydrolase family 2 TIM barrel-domain containing protein [Bryobacteraceae bacterium]
TVLEPPPAAASLKPQETLRVAAPAADLHEPKLWHFDHPHLYRLEVEIEGHRYSTTFGIRSIEVRGEGFYLNGERVWLMGVERMAGSHPEYGMAEPTSWLQHDHDDLKELNCVFTRVHWPQDRRVLDYCDRHGILIQTEIPTWGGQTFAGMRDEPSHAILENGLEQLREMIQRDRNHPCIFSWGLCNEINGQNPPAYQFARRMAEEARKLDPGRLRSYASNSLQKTPERDVAGLMDFIEWNEYYETWYRGTPEDMRRNLEQIQRAFPGKPIVISEYGYCACTAERKEGDQRRIEILREHDRIFRENSAVAGLIFFCYNDYRTHVGDKGSGVLKQRVHGVVDLYGGRKPSFEVLRRESSPIAALEVKRHPGSYAVTVQARSGVPAYPVEGYFVRAVLYGAGQIPLEQAEAKLPRLAPGESAEVLLPLQEPHPVLVRFDIVRPTGFSALSEIWKP